MFKLMKYLKKSISYIIIIIILLIVQAACDLSLPEYTSKIVNIGIQQGGIENSVPKVIREGEMDKLLLFMSDDDKAKVLENYKLLNKNNLSDEEFNKYLDEYPKLDKESLYKLNTEDKDIIDKLNGIFGKPILIVSGLESDKVEVAKMKEEIFKNISPEIKVSTNGDIFKVFASMPKKELVKVRERFEEKFSEMPESIISQSSVAYVKSEYNYIGIDTDANQNKYITVAGAKMIGIAFISLVTSILVVYLGARIAAGVGKEMRSNVFRKVLSFSNTEMDRFSTASLITRSTNDIQQIQMLVVMLFRIVFYAPILGVGGVIKVFKTNNSMSWIIGLAVGIIMLIVAFIFIVVMPKFKMVQKLVDKLNLVTREILTGIPVIRAFSTEKHEEKRFDKANMDLTKTNLFVNRVMTCMMPLMMLVMNGITILIVWVGANNIDSGAMQVGDMMAFIQYTMQIIMSFLMISMVSVMLPRAIVSVNRIDEVLTTDLIIKESDLKVGFNYDEKGVVEFKNVSFKYPNAEEYVLKDISFTAKPGETTAFIGSTGSGKSTLINLIPRFYDVTDGEILVDGADIRKVSEKELREKLGYVPQKGILFSGTIESNLKYGKEEISDKELSRAAKIAQAIEFIEAKPEGFESEISQGGTNVSGGQKQRLSIARAIAKNPEIYIFDDSFSALDFKTDATLRKALKKEVAESTVLIVAQRISTILHAEQIIVLDEGRVVGKGTHKELLKNCEVYRQIASSQLSKEELENE